MKKLHLILILTLIFYCCQVAFSQEQSSPLWKAYKEENYFRLNHMLAKSGIKSNGPECLLFKAKLGYVFNKPRESDSLINILLDKYSDAFNDTIIADLVFMRSVNLTRLEDYKNAFTDGSLFVEKYHHLYDSAFINETVDDNTVREILSGVPKLEVIKTSDIQVPIKRDVAGLINLPVYLKSDSVNFVFDTGANMSVIVSSLAKKYGFKPLAKKIYIMAITGKRIEAELALVDLKIGTMEINHSPFIIFPDSILSFANGAYIIKGIVGFPIMNALKEIVLTDDKYLLVPKVPEKTDQQNFALDQSNPVILVSYKNDTLPFHFDTGANATMLYESFFNRYKNDIEKNCQKSKNQLGGAGGSAEVETYILNNPILSAGNVETKLDSLIILTKSLMSNQEHLYGNFGQDFIKRYKEMKINFEAMSIRFSK